MELWQLDVMEVRLSDDSAVKVLTGLDDHSRFCVVAHAMPRATARPVCEAFAEALSAYGVPQAVLTDNGRVFTGRHTRTGREVLFDRICRENGIRHLLTPRHEVPSRVSALHRVAPYTWPHVVPELRG